MSPANPAHIRHTEEGLVLDSAYLLCLQHFDGFSRRLLQFYASVTKRRKLEVTLSARAPGPAVDTFTFTYETSDLNPRLAPFLDLLDAGAGPLKEDYGHPQLQFLTDVGWEYYLVNHDGVTMNVGMLGADQNDEAFATPLERAFLDFHRCLFDQCVALYEHQFARLADNA